MTDDPEFYAWLDGELDPDAAARMAAKVAADPDLSAQAAQHRALAGRLRAAFDPIASEPVPAHIAQAGRGAEIVDFTAARSRRRMLPSWGVQAAAMAASLAFGLVVGAQWPRSTGLPIASRDGQLIASSSLGAALDTHLASAPAANGARIGLSFRNADGQFCRTFTDGGSSGLACHTEGRWLIRGLFQSGEGQGGAYRMAAGPDPQLMAMVEQSMVGEPLDATAEAAAARTGWKSDPKTK